MMWNLPNLKYLVWFGSDSGGQNISLNDPGSRNGANYVEKFYKCYFFQLF